MGFLLWILSFRLLSELNDLGIELHPKRCRHKTWMVHVTVPFSLKRHRFVELILTPKIKCYVHNIFTTNHRLLVVISLNLNLTLRLFFSPIIITSNNLPLKICYKNIIKMLFAYHFSKKKKKR